MTPGTDWPALVARKWNRGLAPALNLGGRCHLGYQTARPAPYTVRVTLKEACEERGLSVYQVAMSGHAQGTVDPGTVYRLARGDTSRIDLHTLATLAGILHTLTGQPVGRGRVAGPGPGEGRGDEILGSFSKVAGRQAGRYLSQPAQSPTAAR